MREGLRDSDISDESEDDDKQYGSPAATEFPPLNTC